MAPILSEDRKCEANNLTDKPPEPSAFVATDPSVETSELARPSPAIDRSEVDIAASASASELKEDYTRVLNREEENDIKMTLGAPHHADWHALIRGGVFNPGKQELTDDTCKEVDFIVSQAQPLLEQLGAYVATTQALELEELRAAGIAVTLGAGESPWSKLREKDLVYSVQRDGSGLAASRSKMPRLREAQAGLMVAGKELALRVTAVLERRGVLLREDGAWLSRLVSSWHM